MKHLQTITQKETKSLSADPLAGNKTMIGPPAGTEALQASRSNQYLVLLVGYTSGLKHEQELTKKNDRKKGKNINGRL